MKKIARSVACGLIVAGLAAAYIFHVRKDMSDFGVGYRSVERILAGETLYRSSDGHLQYKYAPVSGLFYAAFGLLPWEAAKACWFVLEIVLLVASFYLASRLLPPRGQSLRLTAGLSALILAKYIGREVELGQVNVLIVFLVLLAVRSLERGREVPAGYLWAASLFFKPYAVVFLPYLMLKRKWRTIGVGVGTLALGLAVPAFFFGWKGNLVVLEEWIRSLAKSTPALLAVGDNASLYAFFSKNLGNGEDVRAGVFFLAGTAVLAAVFVWLYVRGNRRAVRAPEVLEAAYLMASIPLISPLGWIYNYLYGLLAVMIVIDSFPRFPAAGRWALAANFVLIGATLREVLGKTAFAFYTFHGLAAISFLVVLGALAYLRGRDIA